MNGSLTGVYNRRAGKSFLLQGRKEDAGRAEKYRERKKSDFIRYGWPSPETSHGGEPSTYKSLIDDSEEANGEEEYKHGITKSWHTGRAAMNSVAPESRSAWDQGEKSR